jgi:hypothetical protein
MTSEPPVLQLLNQISSVCDATIFFSNTFWLLLGLLQVGVRVGLGGDRTWEKFCKFKVVAVVAAALVVLQRYNESSFFLENIWMSYLPGCCHD